MNRQRRNLTRKRCALRGGSMFQPGGFMEPGMMKGGGFSTNPSPLVSTTGVTAPREVIQWLPENGLAYARNGMLVNQPNPALAQVAMAGGGARRKRLERLRKKLRGGGCPCNAQRGGGSLGNLMYGISGSGGYSTNPGMSVGGSGPNVGALIGGNGCYPSIRSGMIGGTRRKHRGGGGSTYAGADCYRGTNSMLPVYPNPSAGFSQAPSTWSLPTGVANVYQLYNPTIARVGGGRKTRRH